MQSCFYDRSALTFLSRKKCSPRWTSWSAGEHNSLVEILGHEIRRRRLMQILSEEDPILRSEDHPEWKDGSYAWVRERRDHSDRKRLEKLGDRLTPRE